MQKIPARFRRATLAGAAAITAMATLFASSTYAHQDAGAKPAEKVRSGEKSDAKASAKADWMFPASATVDVAKIVGPPPQPGTPEQTADLNTLLFVQADRNALDEEHAWTGVSVDIPFFNRALGARFEREWYPKTYALIMDAMKDAKKANNAAKLVYKRPRPYETDPRVKPILPLENSPSYPSGHAFSAMTMGLLLADLFPERTDHLLKYAQNCGFARVDGGVHYPSDIAASVKGAEALAKAILASPEWAARKAEVIGEVEAIKKHSTWGGNVPR